MSDNSSEEYSDSQRLDELATADDYNRFEEEQLAQDRDAGEFDYNDFDIDYDEDEFVYDTAMAGGYAGLGIRF